MCGGRRAHRSRCAPTHVPVQISHPHMRRTLQVTTAGCTGSTFPSPAMAVPTLIFGPTLLLRPLRTLPRTRSGDPVHLFSSRYPRTVQQHFHWTALHGVDGAFLQRFAGQCETKLGNLGIRDLRDEIGDREREAAASLPSCTFFGSLPMAPWQY